LIPIGIALLILSLFVVSFFRDFPRNITAARDEIVSPADGNYCRNWRD
jgi:hypothetical protein